MISGRVKYIAFAALALLYTGTVARYLTHADSPEFVALMEVGGFAHAPGYPTVVLFYRLFSWVPGDPRLIAGLVTAAVGFAAIVVIYRGCRAWGVDDASSLLAAMLIGANSQVWLVHTHPEVFAFNNLFAALIVWLSAPNGPFVGLRRAAGLGLLAGLGLGAHHSLVLIAPVGIWAVYRSVKESNAGALVIGATMLVTGLGVYTYVLVVDSPISFGRVDGFGDLLNHFLRRDYGTTQLGAQGELQPLRQLWFWLVESLMASMMVGLLLLFGGVAEVARGERDGWGWRLLAVAWLLSGPVFVSLFNLDPVGPRVEIVKRFHVLPFIIGAPLLGAGVAWFRSLELRPLILRSVFAVGFGGLLVVGGYRTHAVYDATIEDYLLNTLETMPEGAVVFGQGDHRYFGYQYFQAVEGRRPDIVPVEPMTLGYPWLVERMRKNHDVDFPMPEIADDGTRHVDLRRAIRAAHEAGRPVFVTRDSNEDILTEYELVPYGAAWRVLKDHEQMPDAATVFAENVQLYNRFEHRAAPPSYQWNPWGWSLFSIYRRVWQDIEERCANENADCAASANTMRLRYPDL